MFRKPIAAALAFFSLAPPPVFAAPAAAMAWVSVQGADSPTCGALKTPCRSFQYTHDNIVASNGEIRVRDPGGYGSLIIRKPISIINAGVGVAAISQTSGSAAAISVQAGPSDAVFLQGLTLEGAGTGSIGIDVASAGFFAAANCVIKGFSIVSGLRISPSNDMKFSVSDSFISGGVDGSVQIYGYPYKVEGTLTRLELVGSNTGPGIKVGETVVVVASQLNISNNQTNGVDVYGKLLIGRSMITGNDTGVTIRLGGSVYSYGNNEIDKNNYNVFGGALLAAYSLR